MQRSNWTGLGVAAAVALAAVPAMAGEAAEKEPFGRLTVEEVEAGIAKKELVVLDANSPERFAKGRVPGAKWVDSNNVTAKDLPADKGAKLVFYCGSEKCMASHTGAKAALSLGYKNVFIMPAGIKGWEAAGKKTESGS